MGPCGYEGIYTDRFTYRPGDVISVFASLVSSAKVAISISRLDGVPPLTQPQAVATYPVQSSDVGNVERPGETGAFFPVVLQLPADQFAPGVYAAQIPLSALQPQNQLNSSNGFPSDNSVSYFVVTPSVAGSSSRLLWLHDSLTGTAYGSFAGASIYIGSAGLMRTVSYFRPGLNRAAVDCLSTLQFFQTKGYAFEHVDLLDLAAAPVGYLNAYDLVCVVGQFEYIPKEVIDQFESYLGSGGNLFAASHEFGTFRVRLDASTRTLTTYKWDELTTDPFFLSGEPTQLPHVAGVGMRSLASPYETEIMGQTVWAANQLTNAGGVVADLPVYNLQHAGWILDGTGIGAGGVLPQAINNLSFASGCCLQFDASNQPSILLAGEMRIPPETIVWAALPSSGALDWRGGGSIQSWPALSSAYATATMQQRSSRSQVVSLPTPLLSSFRIGWPVYDRVLLNLINRLSVRS
jgi:hypothetical protein